MLQVALLRGSLDFLSFSACVDTLGSGGMGGGFSSEGISRIGDGSR